MSDAARSVTCPACGTNGTSTTRAYQHEQPCPTCGLGYAAARDIFERRDTLRSDEQKAEFEYLRLENDRLNRLVAGQDAALQSIRGQVSKYDSARAEQERLLAKQRPRSLDPHRYDEVDD